MVHFLRPRLRFFILMLSALLVISAGEASAQKKRTRKATEDEDDVVKNKLFPKKTKFEIAGPDVGVILNQSYLNTFVVHANAGYFWSEDWGFIIEGLLAINQDKSERACIENFYNDPNQNVGSPCPSIGQDVADPLIEEYNSDGTPKYKSGANFGPAYVGIRELKTVLTASAIWNPFYGKSLAFMSNTIYFDLFLTMGAGLALTNYYPKSIFLKNGQIARPHDIDKDAIDNLTKCDEAVLGGVCPENPDRDSYIGTPGRPEPIAENTPTITLGIGQKFHFKDRYNFKAEIRNYTLFSAESGVDTFFMLWAGFGVRL